MRKQTTAASPQAYLTGLSGWQRSTTEALRSAVRSAAPLDEVIKWGHLVYLSNGPLLLIRAEEQRVLLGFWRGQRLCALAPCLKPGGKYEMATASLGEGEMITAVIIRKLVLAAINLNRELGDPTKLV